LKNSISIQLALVEKDGLIDPKDAWQIRCQSGRPNSLWEDRVQIRRATSNPKSTHIQGLLSEDMSVGDGALDGETLDRIEQLFQQTKPAGVVEFGSGSSTIVLGSLLAQQYGKNKVRMVSVEQDEEWCALTRQRLQKAGLDGVVQVYHAPLDEGPGGIPAACYTLSPQCQQHIRELKPDFCLIDGPAYRAGQTRVQVWHKVKDLLAPGAHVLLDDSFRDPELWIAKRWAQYQQIEMIGIWSTSKGVTQIRLPE
jgi:predicted O-methyltransferase YrrM